MPHRSYASTANYRFGFNGKENDNEPKGLGNQQDYGMRVYDTRIGRFLSVDPLQVKYSWITPYHFGGNNPTASIDLDGRDTIRFVTTKYFFPSITGPSGLQIGGGSSTSHSVVVTKAPGKDVFYVQTVIVDMAAHGNPTSSGRVQFYPNGDGPNGQGGVLQGTGITESEGGLLFTTRNDEDFTTLAKLAPKELVAYLEKHDPDKYGSLGLHQAGLTIGEAGRQLAGVALLFEGGITLQGKSSTSFSVMSARASAFTRLETLSGNASARAVGDIMSKMKAGIKMEPIEVIVHNGKKYVLNGHHRLEAASRLGKNVDYVELSLEAAKSRYHYNSLEEILNAAAEAGVRRNKLDAKIVTKAASTSN